MASFKPWFVDSLSENILIQGLQQQIYHIAISTKDIILDINEKISYNPYIMCPSAHYITCHKALVVVTKWEGTLFT